MEDIRLSKPLEFVSPVSSPVKPARSSHLTLNPIMVTEERPVTLSPHKLKKKIILPPMEKDGNESIMPSMKSQSIKDAIRESRAEREKAIKVIKTHMLATEGREDENVNSVLEKGKEEKEDKKDIDIMELMDKKKLRKRNMELKELRENGVNLSGKTKKRRSSVEEQLLNEEEEKAREAAKAHKEATKRRRMKVEKARREAEEKARREAEEKAQIEAEEKEHKEVEEKAREAAKAHKEATKRRRMKVEKAHREAQENARREAQEKAQIEAEEKARIEVEEKEQKKAQKEAGESKLTDTYTNSETNNQCKEAPFFFDGVDLPKKPTTKRNKLDQDSYEDKRQRMVNFVNNAVSDGASVFKQHSCLISSLLCVAAILVATN